MPFRPDDESRGEDASENTWGETSITSNVNQNNFSSLNRQDLRGIEFWSRHNASTNSGSNWVPPGTRIILSAMLFRATQFETSGMRVASKASAIERIPAPSGVHCHRIL